MEGNKITKGRKNTIPVIIAALFITILFSPSFSAEEPLNQNQKLTIWLPDITQDDYFTQIQVSFEDLQIFIDDIGAILDVINTTMSPESQEGGTITNEEWQQIGISVNDFIKTIKLFDKNFPNVNTKQLLSDMIEAFFNPLGGFLRPRPIFSVGIGFTWIPFYGYESFMGSMFRPILSRYILGFTYIGGILDKHFMIGSYTTIKLCFSGLFINFGDIGRERVIGPTMFIGTVLFSRM